MSGPLPDANGLVALTMDTTDEASPLNGDPKDEASPLNGDPEDEVSPPNDNLKGDASPPFNGNPEDDASATDDVPMDDGSATNDSPMEDAFAFNDNPSDDTSPINDNLTDGASNGGTGSMTIPTSSPTDISVPQSLNLPTLLPPGTETSNHSPTDINPGDASETSVPTPLPIPGNLSPALPPDLSPPTHLPQNAQPLGITFTQPPLESAGNGTFNLTGVIGDYISESTRTFWESVPGGEKWVAMVKSYLELQTIPPSKGVRSRTSYIIIFYK